MLLERSCHTVQEDFCVEQRSYIPEENGSGKYASRGQSPVRSLQGNVMCIALMYGAEIRLSGLYKYNMLDVHTRTEYSVLVHKD